MKEREHSLQAASAVLSGAGPIVHQCVSAISALERAAYLENNPDDAEVALRECWGLLLTRAMVTAASTLVVRTGMDDEGGPGDNLLQRREKAEWTMIHTTLLFKFRTMSAAQFKVEKEKTLQGVRTAAGSRTASPPALCKAHEAGVGQCGG